MINFCIFTLTECGCCDKIYMRQACCPVSSLFICIKKGNGLGMIISHLCSNIFLFIKRLLQITIVLIWVN